eukprot:gene10619-16341_t
MAPLTRSPSAEQPEEDEEEEESGEVVERVRQWLVREVAKNDGDPAAAAARRKTALFDAEGDEGVGDLINSLWKYANSSPAVFVVALLFAVRYASNTGDTLVKANARKVYLAAFVVAVKLRDDEYYTNRFYGRLGGVSTEDFNVLEEQFLIASQWDISLPEEECQALLSSLAAGGPVQWLAGGSPLSSDGSAFSPALRFHPGPHAAFGSPVGNQGSPRSEAGKSSPRRTTVSFTSRGEQPDAPSPSPKAAFTRSSSLRCSSPAKPLASPRNRGSTSGSPTHSQQHVSSPARATRQPSQTLLVKEPARRATLTRTKSDTLAVDAGRQKRGSVGGKLGETSPRVKAGRNPAARKSLTSSQKIVPALSGSQKVAPALASSQKVAVPALGAGQKLSSPPARLQVDTSRPSPVVPSLKVAVPTLQLGVRKPSRQSVSSARGSQASPTAALGASTRGSRSGSTSAFARTATD